MALQIEDIYTNTNEMSPKKTKKLEFVNTRNVNNNDNHFQKGTV